MPHLQGPLHAFGVVLRLLFIVRETDRFPADFRAFGEHHGFPRGDGYRVRQQQGVGLPLQAQPLQVTPPRLEASPRPRVTALALPYSPFPNNVLPCWAEARTAASSRSARPRERITTMFSRSCSVLPDLKT